MRLRMLLRTGCARGLSARVGIGIASGLIVAGGLAAAVIPAHAAAQANPNCPTVAADGMVTPAPSTRGGEQWSGCDLQNANLAATYLGGAYLSGANLSQAILTGSGLENAYLSGANLTG